MNQIRKTLVLSYAALLLAAGAAAEIVQLPLDASPGMPPTKVCTVSDTEYKDATIWVTVREGRMFDCTYWVEDIRIKDAAQLRTAAANGFGSSSVKDSIRLASENNAIAAVNGDYYTHTNSKYIFRQGKLYTDTLRGVRDILLIDVDGDFHALHLAGKNSIGEEIDGKKLANVLSFGPVLVEDGKAIADFGMVSGIAVNDGRQRVAIAQAGPLHYKLFCCAGNRRGSKGMTVEQFAQMIEQEGAIIAYNLDGGDSSMMYFNGRKVNDDNRTARKINDIVYFASAYVDEESK